MSLKVEQYIDLGSHGMFICSVTESRVMNHLETMTYSYYHENVKPKPETDGKKGYVYAGGNNLEELTEASYGGAYDIADDQYFTKEELLTLNKQLNKISKK